MNVFSITSSWAGPWPPRAGQGKIFFWILQLVGLSVMSDH